ncbi:cation:proton antiporter [Streptomyces griseoviridis]|uniref:Kef-type K+ transport system membrane component KefB n=2 Tax=Streptomyces griseoviridis TaxID=45398 RepID=A0ABT9L790_STRGD|nr:MULTISPECIES: cation:proton antiporter [Streptomyces]MDP9679577.1 Kef-type K+ transport system membrane component KefB [Streptomyces griseoviridis]GGS40167.1 cation:proton antiporter [Streptomyces niveoruber]GGT00118.1 cation:proton antiporter [Streptomyces griseoviridis]
MSATDLAPAFFLAVVVILVVCRAVSRLLALVGQPPVVGEMLAGVVLGPSVLGALLPGVESGLFPQDLRPVLYVVGQIGLVAFMFHVGWDFRVDRLRGVARPAGLVSAAGVVVPVVLGVLLIVAVGERTGAMAPDISLTVSALFVGVALAVTAFPMLARIIAERNLAGTRYGSLSLGAGAVDDAVAWILLAGVFSIAGGSAGLVSLAVGGGFGLIAILAVVVRLRGRTVLLAERATPENLLLVLVGVLFLVAWYADEIGLYAVFGAFSLGLVFPRSRQLDRSVETLEPVGRLFLPLFFTYSGLNTDFTLLGSGPVLLFTAGCVVVAIAGKFGACWLAARAAGEPNRVALRVGALMNARGLMQLIALNLGLAAGIVTQAMFSALVVVAIVTTVMATPLLALIDRWERSRGERDDRPDPAPVVAA